MLRYLRSDRSLAERPDRGPDAQHVSLPQCPALETAEPAQDVRRRATQKRLHARFPPERKDNSALPNAWGPGEAFDLAEPQPTSTDRRPHSSRVAPKSEPVSARIAPSRKQKCSAEQRHLQSSRTLGIGDQPVSEAQRNRIGSSRRRNAQGTEAFSPQILHRGEQARRLNLNHAHAFSSAANRAWKSA